MARTAESYNDHTIVLVEEENHLAKLQIDNHLVVYSVLKNGHYHSDYIPYQDFENLIDLAKYIIDHLPNVAFDAN